MTRFIVHMQRRYVLSLFVAASVFSGCGSTANDIHSAGHDAATLDAVAPAPPGTAGGHAEGADRDGDGISAPFDCDDGDAQVHPGAPERRNGVDDDCDGQIDEAVETGGACRPNLVRGRVGVDYEAATSFAFPFGPGTGTCPGRSGAPDWWVSYDFRAATGCFGDNTRHLGEDWNYRSGSDDVGQAARAPCNGVIVDVVRDPDWVAVLALRCDPPEGHHFEFTDRGHPRRADLAMMSIAHVEPSPLARVGQAVRQGDVLGTISGTLCTICSGPHAHWEVIVDCTALFPGDGYSGQDEGRTDPSDFIRTARVVRDEAGPCPTGTMRCGELCADLLRDPAHCGACGNACPSGARCEEGRCANCNAGVPCRPPAAVDACTVGVTTCLAGTAVCSPRVAPAGTACADGRGRCDGAGRCMASCSGQGTACPSGNPCQAGVWDCATGAGRCLPGAPAAAGTPCSGGVCDGRGACSGCQETPCVPGACRTGRISCASGVARCVALASSPPGSPCSGGVCDGAGGCVVCAAGSTCTHAAPCQRGQITCASGAPRCESVGPAPAGSPCPGGVCRADGSCIACVEGSACTPAGSVCRRGAMRCGAGEPRCDDAGAAADGTACGGGRSCERGVCRAPFCRAVATLTSPSDGARITSSTTLRWSGPLCRWRVKGRWCCGSGTCDTSMGDRDGTCAEVFNEVVDDTSFQVSISSWRAECFRWVAVYDGCESGACAPMFFRVCRR